MTFVNNRVVVEFQSLPVKHHKLNTDEDYPDEDEFQSKTEPVRVLLADVNNSRKFQKMKILKPKLTKLEKYRVQKKKSNPSFALDNPMQNFEQDDLKKMEKLQRNLSKSGQPDQRLSDSGEGDSNEGTDSEDETVEGIQKKWHKNFYVGNKQRHLQVNLSCNYTNLRECLEKKDYLRQTCYHGNVIYDSLEYTSSDKRQPFNIHVVDFVRFPVKKKDGLGELITPFDSHLDSSYSLNDSRHQNLLNSESEYLDGDLENFSGGEKPFEEVAGDTDPTRFYGILDYNVNKFLEIQDILSSMTVKKNLTYPDSICVGSVYWSWGFWGVWKVFHKLGIPLEKSISFLEDWASDLLDFWLARLLT